MHREPTACTLAVSDERGHYTRPVVDEQVTMESQMGPGMNVTHDPRVKRCAKTG